MNRDQAIEFDNLSLWKVFRAELDSIIIGETERLIHTEDKDKLIRLQERVKTMRLVTRLPQIIAEREEVDEASEEKGE